MHHRFKLELRTSRQQRDKTLAYAKGDNTTTINHATSLPKIVMQSGNALLHRCLTEKNIDQAGHWLSVLACTVFSFKEMNNLILCSIFCNNPDLLCFILKFTSDSGHQVSNRVFNSTARIAFHSPLVILQLFKMSSQWTDFQMN